MAKRTDAEKKAWREKMTGLCQKVSGMSPEQREEIARKMPVVTCEGHPISGWNCSYLASQSDHTFTVIGGFSQWKKAGRMVTKGQKSLARIFVPMGRKKDPDGGPEGRVNFRSVPMFDITQTEEAEAAAA